MIMKDSEWHDWPAKHIMTIDDFLTLPAALTSVMAVALIDLWFALATVARNLS